MSDNIILWGLAASPYVRKVMIALAEKQLTYTLTETAPLAVTNALGEPVNPAFAKASPLGKIPAIKIGDITLSDSAIINRYLDQRFDSGNTLYPKAPELLANVNWFEMYADVELTKVIYQKIFLEKVVKPLVLNVEPDHAIVDNAITNELPPLLTFLNTHLNNNQYFVDNTFSGADIAILVQLLSLEMSGIEISSKQYPQLDKFIKINLTRDSLGFLK